MPKFTNIDRTRLDQIVALGLMDVLRAYLRTCGMANMKASWTTRHSVPDRK